MCKRIEFLHLQLQKFYVESQSLSNNLSRMNKETPEYLLKKHCQNLILQNFCSIEIRLQRVFTKNSSQIPSTFESSFIVDLFQLTSKKVFSIFFFKFQLLRNHLSDSLSHFNIYYVPNAE